MNSTIQTMIPMKVQKSVCIKSRRSALSSPTSLSASSLLSYQHIGISVLIHTLITIAITITISSLSIITDCHCHRHPHHHHRHHHLRRQPSLSPYHDQIIAISIPTTKSRTMIITNITSFTYHLDFFMWPSLPSRHHYCHQCHHLHCLHNHHHVHCCHHLSHHHHHPHLYCHHHR